MADLTREDVLKLARLARLTITDEEVEKYRAELSEILHYVEQLQSADVEGLQPTSQVTGLKNVMAEDEIVDIGVTPDDLLKIAPHTEGRYVKVKRMIG
ncbi:MAG TPA: Asp-tRNA(Asn)/Glu-tRNA(Gln) amidotransferase subunit GatC [Candidatus Pristimantibacillus sp.]|jgi:aspartyl-tRNA(Asn)/glutamyl-tRNA(Gln) amidotransferase subunit C|nr:Asp-tRNA(Asn)/Glu-tRNA(Gln) amidotransferase subunit GatC [Candidatus Pristimantibacillus sp.]